MAREGSDKLIELSKRKTGTIESGVGLATSSSGTKARESGNLLLFFAATFGITWICWIPVIVIPIADHTILRQVLVLIGTFAPALVALTLISKCQGGTGLQKIFHCMTRWEVGARWYLLAIAYMATIKLTAAVVNRMITGSWPQFGNEPWYLLAIATIFSTPVQAGEEVGWRGYALPGLGERMGYAWGSVVLGVIWAAWHLPIFFIPGADKFGQSFPIWALAVTALSVAIAWIYVHTGGSLLLTMLMHAAVNNTSGIVPAASAPIANPFTLKASLILRLTVALLWIPAVYFLYRMPIAPKTATSQS